MTAPDLDALQALLAKATPGPWWQEPFGLIVSQNENESGKRAFIAAPTGDANAALIVAAVNTLPALIKRVRELERDRESAALAMRERCAQACEELSVDWFPRDKHDAAREGAIMRCAAAIRALEP